MIGRFSDENSILENLCAAIEIYAGSESDDFHPTSRSDEKIAIERLAVHLGHPAGVRLTHGGVNALSTLRRRRPIYLSPPRPPELVDRSAELETLYQTLYNYNTADVYGPDGAGKSTLMATLIHNLDRERFPDGVVFASGHFRHPDLLQGLFESFYESDHRIKITLRHAPTYLYNLRALVALDDLGLGPKQIDPVLDALGNAAVLIAGSDRTAVGRGLAVPLKSLPRREAVTLFEKTLGRAPVPEEQAAIQQICETLRDMPLPIMGTAAHAAQHKVPLAELLADLQGRKPWAGPGGDPAIGPSLEQLVAALDSTDRRLLTLIAAFDATSVSSAALRALTSLPRGELQKHIEHLQQLKLLLVIEPGSRDDSPRLALSPAHARAVRTWLVDDALRAEMVNYYVTQLKRGERLPGAELAGLVGAIEVCARNGWLDALKPLVRAADRSLAWLGWWAEWEHVLDLTRRTAQAQKDRVLEAWATHQLGSLLGTLALFADGPEAGSERAFHLLRTAANLRQALDDESGAAASAHNLQLLDRLMPPPVVAPPAAEQPAPETPPADQVDGPASETPAAEVEAPPARPTSRWRTRVLAAVVALILLISLTGGALGLRALLQGDQVGAEPAGLTISWEFGDAWNALDNQTWTQQIIIVVEDDVVEDGAVNTYRYFADGQPVGEMFEIILPLCEGARGTLRVESASGETAQVEYAFDSPFCR